MSYQTPTSQIETWIKHRDQRTQRVIRWLHKYGLKTQRTHEEIGDELKQPNGRPYSGDSVYQALTGRRTDEQLVKFLEAVERLESLERERDTITRAEFVETTLTRKIFAICDGARNFNKLQFIFGNSHIGKTTALEEYTRRNNHGATIYLRAPALGTLGATLDRLISILNLPIKGSNNHKAERIISCFNHRMILIVDEAHQFLYSRKSLATLEFLRELHDRTSAGLVIGATDVFEQALDDPTFSKVLKQFKMRSLITAKLPDIPAKRELDQFAKHFGLDPAQDRARDLQTHVIHTTSLGRWVSILEGASRLASKDKTSTSWDHVLKAHAALDNLEKS